MVSKRLEDWNGVSAHSHLALMSWLQDEALGLPPLVLTGGPSTIVASLQQWGGGGAGE